MRVITFKRLRLRPKLRRPKSMWEGIFLRQRNASIGRPDLRKIRQISSYLSQSRAFAPKLASPVDTSNHSGELKSP
jgi:hypothetical protein